MTTETNHNAYATLPTPPMHRRIIAMLYDFAVASTGILIIASILISFISPNENIPPFSPLANMLFALELLLSALYFILFWLKKEATLGMSVWKLRISKLTGGKITLLQAIIRYSSIIAIMTIGFIAGYKLLGFGSGNALLMAFLFLGLSLIWSLFNPHKIALHEQLSGTKLVDIRTDEQKIE